MFRGTVSEPRNIEKSQSKELYLIAENRFLLVEDYDFSSRPS